MHHLTDVSQVKQLGTILSVWAHPDDETFFAGGLMAAAVRNGQKVVCVTATKGEASTLRFGLWRPGRLGQTRVKELNAAMKILGVKDHQWLDYADNCCCDAPEADAATSINKIIEVVKPDTILTFSPDGVTGHPDHKAVSKWVSLAVQESTKPIRVLQAVHTQDQYDKYMKLADEKINLYFAIDKPVLREDADCAVNLELPSEIAELKYQALAAMRSQYDQFFHSFDKHWITKALATESFIEAKE